MRMLQNCELKIALFQVDIVWESPKENCRRYSELLEKFFLSRSTDTMPDIVVFPEFFTTGFTMDTSFAETASGVSVEWMRGISEKYNVAIIASLPIKDGEEKKVFNRCFFIAPGGKEYHYDKRHLFRMGGEPKHYMAGNLPTIISYKSWNIALNICYDLRFPVWSRNVGLGYDIMINIASWPGARINIVEHLVKARALENLAYYAFLNRVGEDVDNTYSGQSRIVDYKGNDIAQEYVIDGAQVYTASLEKEKLTEFRNKFPAWKDADTFKII